MHYLKSIVFIQSFLDSLPSQMFQLMLSATFFFVLTLQIGSTRKFYFEEIKHRKRITFSIEPSNFLVGQLHATKVSSL